MFNLETLKESLSRIKSNKLLFLALPITLVFFVLLLILLFSPKTEKRGGNSDTASVQITPVNQRYSNLLKTADTIPPAPKVIFASYENRAPMPVLPSQVNVYKFQTDFPLPYVLDLGRKLGLTEVKNVNNRYVILYNFSNPGTMGMLTFDKSTGGYLFQSYGNHVLPNFSAVSTAAATVQSYLNYLGLADATTLCSATYNRQGIPNTTFVECHRDWQKVGLPILSAVGVLNVPEENKLSDVKLGRTVSYPLDNSIINTSTNQDGIARPNDFNTITVGVTAGGKIASIESNIRTIKETSTYSSNDLLSPQEALDQFISHKSQFALTVPAGSGYIDWKKVYPQGAVQSQKAVITDYLLTYIEKPKDINQEILAPMYLIKGIANLPSGYTARFTEMVPALKNGLSFIGPVKTLAVDNQQIITPSIIPVETKSVKLGSFNPATPTPPPTQFGLSHICSNSNPTSSEYAVNVPGIGNIYFNTDQARGGPHVFFFRCSTFPVQDMEQVRDLFFKGPIADQYLINISRWLSQSPNLSVPYYSNIQDMYKFFIKTSGTTNCDAGNIVPPIPNCIQEAGHQGFYNMDRINSTSENVAIKMLNIINNSQIPVWANKQDIIPSPGPGPNNGGFTTLSGVFMSFDPQFLAQPSYVSGESPSLYFYPEKSEKIDISIQAPLTYSNPSYSSSWHIQADPYGNLISLDNQLPYHRLYYEYDKQNIVLKEPAGGFVVEKTAWEDKIRSIASDLKLNSTETEDLVTDVRNAVAKFIHSPFLKISIIDREEIDHNLPLYIAPKPEKIYRVHLMITPINNFKSIPQPHINPLERKGFTVVELGVYSSNK